MKIKRDWKTIPNYEDYEVSDDGFVRNKRSGHIMRHQQNKKNGYIQVMLRTFDGKVKLAYMHRLVADAFVENPDPENLTSVYLKDGNKLNCKAENLVWGYKDRFKTYEEGIVERHYKEPKYEYVVKKIHPHTGAVIATYLDFELLESQGYLRGGVRNAAKNCTRYKHYNWTYEKIC